MDTIPPLDPPDSDEPTSFRARIVTSEHALTTEEAQSTTYTQVLATVNDAIIILDPTYRIRTWNPAAERIYGWSAQDVVGKFLRDVLVTRYLDGSSSEQAVAAIRGHALWTGLVAQNHRDGHDVIIESAVRPLYGPNGTFQGFVGINRDISIRYQAQEALRASEERFRLAVDHFPYVFVIYDGERRFQFVNAVGLRLSGYTEGQILGRRDEEVFDATVTRDYLPLLQRAVATGQTQQGECTISLASGTYRVEVTYIPILTPNGAVQQILGITHDVTDRVRAEMALKHSEATLRAFFEGASPAYYLLDRAYTILAFNRVTAQQVRRIWHKDIREGDSVLEYVNPANRDLFITHYQRCLQGETISYERRVDYPNSITAWYELRYTPITSAEGEVIGVAFSGEDITARKAAEVNLAHREAQLTGIIDSAMDAIITVDVQQRIVLFNRAAEQLFGCQAADVLGQSLDRFIPLEAQAAHREHIKIFGDTGVTRRSMSRPGVLEAVRADNTRFPIEATISQIIVDEQTLYTVILRDISERLQLQAELVQSQKLESVGQLAGGIAHDFNNLLTIIGGASDMARDMLPADHPARADLQDVAEAVRRAAGLTHQLLAFARRQILASHILDINELVGETEQLLRRLIGANIHLVTTLAPGLPPIKADPNRLQQVLINLAVNARDAMPYGGQLQIRTLCVDAARAKVEQYGDAPAVPYVRIEVQDTGTGMAPQVVSRIFEPFFTTKEPGKGTGLGLSTSYGIVKQHGGTIWVESVLGRGTTITIALPVADPKLEPAPARGEKDSLPRGTETVLLVEDEETVRSLTARMLVELGYTVMEAPNGAQARAISTTERQIDLLLTDLVMPGEDGIALAAGLLSERPNLAVVYMTGYADHIRLEALRNRAGTVLIQKPFRRGELARIVRSVLDQRRMVNPS